jgi:hypothetical protein
MKGFGIAVVMTFAACAHHRDVRPGEEGINKVVLMTQEKDFEGRPALSQAEHYCETMGRRPVIVSETNQYVGSMDEGSYNNVHTGAKVAQTVGAVGHVFGGKKESDAGGVVGLGGIVAEGAIGKGYRYEMKFKCQ